MLLLALTMFLGMHLTDVDILFTNQKELIVYAYKSKDISIFTFSLV